MLLLSSFDLHGNIVRLQEYSLFVAKTHLLYIGKFAPKGLYSTHSYLQEKEYVMINACIYEKIIVPGLEEIRGTR